MAYHTERIDISTNPTLARIAYAAAQGTRQELVADGDVIAVVTPAPRRRRTSRVRAAQSPQEFFERFIQLPDVPGILEDLAK